MSRLRKKAEGVEELIHMLQQQHLRPKGIIYSRNNIHTYGLHFKNIDVFHFELWITLLQVSLMQTGLLYSLLFVSDFQYSV